MKYFPPEQRVMVNVRMTKCLYAMATHCDYTGDPQTGWNIPPATCSKYNAHILGIKIACGLEMLVARANENRKKRWKLLFLVDTEKEKEKVKSHEAVLDTYFIRLGAGGYYRSLSKGSEERKKLLTETRDYYLTHCNVPPVDNSEKVLEACEDILRSDVELHVKGKTNAMEKKESEKLHNDDDHFAIFGKYVASTIRQIEDKPFQKCAKRRVIEALGAIAKDDGHLQN